MSHQGTPEPLKPGGAERKTPPSNHCSTGRGRARARAIARGWDTAPQALDRVGKQDTHGIV